MIKILTKTSKRRIFAHVQLSLLNIIQKSTPSGIKHSKPTDSDHSTSPIVSLHKYPLNTKDISQRTICNKHQIFTAFVTSCSNIAPPIKIKHT